MSEAFNILGRIQLRIGGRFEDWGPPRLRAILGALLVQVGKPVSYTTLIEWAWRPHEEVPQHRDSTFGTYAQRIRNVLNTMDVRPRLHVQSKSLRIDVDRSLIDYFKMRELIDTARLAASSNDHRTARELAEEAIALWVGPPLIEIETARAERWRQMVVENIWLPANRMLIRQYIVLGELDAAMARLDDLQGDYPDNLGLAKHRIEVLRRLGRHSDADDSYLRLRRRLVADADDESAADLRRFHNRFRESAADVPPTPSPAVRPVLPMQLPHAIPDFVGRVALLRDLDASATSPNGALQSAVLTLTGLPGVGKTSAAVYWARRWHDQHGGGALLIDLHGFGHGPPLDRPRMVDELLHALTFQVDRITGYAGREAKLRELLAQRRLVVVLDNAKDSDQVLPILPLLSTCLVVVTSRRRLMKLGIEHGAREFPVEPLARTESARFLAGRIGDRASADPASVTELAALCGGLPLALHLVAHNIAPQRGIRLSDYVDHLRDLSTLLSLGGDGDSLNTSLAAAFTASYQALPESSRRLFRLIGLHPGPDIGANATAALAGGPVASDLEQLISAHLVERSSAVDRYRCHDLIRAFAARVSVADEMADERMAAELRMLDFYLHTAYHADQKAYYGSTLPMPRLPDTATPLTFADERSAITWCLTERHNLVAAVAFAQSRDHHDHAWLLPHVTLNMFRRYGYFEDALSTLEIAVAAARSAGNVEAEGASLADLGQIYLTLGDHQEARKRFYLGEYIAQVHRFERGIATSYCNRARVEMIEGDYDAAIALYQRAFDAARKLGDGRTQSVAHHQLGNAYRAKRQYGRAFTHYQDALLLRQHIGYRRGEAETLAELAALHHEEGRYELAKVYGVRALEVVESLRDVETAQHVCVVLAEVEHRLGELWRATQFGRRAVDLARRIRNAAREAKALDVLARSQLAAAHLQAAVEGFQQALELYRDLGQPHHVQRIASRLADLAVPSVDLPVQGTQGMDLDQPSGRSAAGG